MMGYVPMRQYSLFEADNSESDRTARVMPHPAVSHEKG